MRIAICSSMDFAKEMISAKKGLEALCHKAVIQDDVHDYADGRVTKETVERKQENDFIRNYYEKIKNCDAILVVNMDKNGIQGYIGGNTFLEMGFAYVLHKKIYLMNPAPKMAYSDEINAMSPIVINCDLSKL
jgi:nucleoside 2-deoxyribosyltransferase